MAISVKPPRALFLITCFILFTVSSTTYFSRPSLLPSIAINTKGQPTIGYAKARVHVVIFEEPKCSHCRQFNEKIFPSIKKDYIDTNKIRYTLIPVSFLPGSMPAAIATLSVFYENPLYPNDELFFKYFDHMYTHQKDDKVDWATTQKLLEFAEATSPAIQLTKLKNDIENQTYRLQIEHNTAYGTHIMGGEIVTPTVFVNGIKLEELSLDSLTILIKDVLKHEGDF